MIDIHTHILPHFDDGAKDTETSLAMLREERSQGVDTVVVTPHYYGRRHSPAQFLERSRSAYQRLAAQVGEGVTLRLGAEVHFTGINIPDYEELCSLAIEGTKYILIEFPFTSVWTKSLTDSLADFVYETGYTPIVAHVERYGEVQKKPAIATELINMGCLLQVNAGSFLHKGERGLALALMRHGMVHCIGSDAHDMGGRAPNMLSARELLVKENLLVEWERTQSIMQKVIRGEQVRVESGKPVKKFLGKYL